MSSLAVATFSMAPVRDRLARHLDFGARVALQTACGRDAATQCPRVHVGVPFLDDLQRLWVDDWCRGAFFHWLNEPCDYMPGRASNVRLFTRYMEDVVRPSVDDDRVRYMIEYLFSVVTGCEACRLHMWMHILAANVLYEHTPEICHRGYRESVTSRQSGRTTLHGEQRPMIKKGDIFVRLHHRRACFPWERDHGSRVDVRRPRRAISDAMVVFEPDDDGGEPVAIVCESRLVACTDEAAAPQLTSVSGTFIMRARA